MEHTFLFKSKAMQGLIAQAELVAASDVPLFLYGETGTGKNILAQYIHEKSGRKKGLFLRVDCSELSRSLLESELFGHEKGAYTGATEMNIGYLDMVCGGSLFLDEVENLDNQIQAKILNVIEEKQFFRVGGRDIVKTDFRLMSATNVDINRHIDSGEFRKDLYYRLKGHIIQIPPLRERRDDIILLADFFLARYCQQFNRKIKLSKSALDCLVSYDWPGNIRELRLVLESTIASHQQEIIELEHLPFEIQRRGILADAIKDHWSANTLLNVYARRLLKLTANNKTKTAKILGWSVNKLKRLLKETRPFN